LAFPTMVHPHTFTSYFDYLGTDVVWLILPQLQTIKTPPWAPDHAADNPTSHATSHLGSQLWRKLPPANVHALRRPRKLACQRCQVDECWMLRKRKFCC
jgi:hypothetical protein